MKIPSKIKTFNGATAAIVLLLIVLAVLGVGIGSYAFFAVNAYTFSAITLGTIVLCVHELIIRKS